MNLSAFLLRAARHLAAAVVASGALVAQAQAQPPADCPAVPAAPTAEELRTLQAAARDRGFLWRIVRDNRTSWLYGTIHVARRDWAFPGPDVSRALRSADVIALELDPQDPSVQAELAQSFATLGRPALPPALAERLAARARAECLPESAFAAMAPAGQAMVLTTLVGRRDGFDPAYGIDALLAGFGHARGVEVASLESPALQMAALDLGGDEETVAWIEATLGELERGDARASLRRLAQAWAEGDLQAMAPTCAGAEPGCVDSERDRRVMRRVLDDRNPGLADGIDALHASGKRVFAAVGSLHMVGPTGLPTLLAGRGYLVERMLFAPP